MKKIYLVDDDEDDLMFARQALESVLEDVEIIELSDGSRLLNLMEQNDLQEPSLVLMDMNMPRVTGLEALSILKTHPEKRHIPVILFSTSASQESVKTAYQLGANAYIVKPSAYEGYMHVAHAINLCFLNSYSTVKPSLNAATLRGKNVMIIEDNADHSSLIRLCLKQEAPGLNLICKNTAEDVVEFFNSAGKAALSSIDLVILDLYMPTRERGLTLLIHIRDMFSINGLAGVPIVILSSSDHLDDIKTSYRHHANAYLVKTSEPGKTFSYLKDLCYFWQNTIESPRETARKING